MKMVSVSFAVWTLMAAVMVIGAHEPKMSSPDPWGRIRLLAREGDNKLFKYLESLKAEEMLTAARQACDEAAAYKGPNRDATNEATAEMHVLLCLHYYFDKVDRNEGGAALIKIASDRAEPPFFRRALISRMHERDEPFDAAFQAYVQEDLAGITAHLTEMLKAKDEHTLVRKECMDFLGGQLYREVSKITRSDPNVRAVWEQTHKVVPVGKLVRSGELTLTEDTVRALRPLELQTIAYVKLLGAILADEKNEPEELRKEARRRLEGYRQSALTGLDQEVEKALQKASD